MRGVYLCVGVMVVVLSGWVGGEAAAVGDECKNDFSKVMTCLTFASGKAETPTKECCSGVRDIKDSDPVCLCYIIEQIHNGSNPQLRSFGIQEARLLRLPSACNLANASSADCPRLLKLPPNSPEAAIFSNSSALTTPGTSSTGTSSSTTANGSNGFKHGAHLGGSVAAITMAVFFFFYAFCTSSG